MKSDELQEVINWLHNDVDKAVDDAKTMYRCLAIEMIQTKFNVWCRMLLA